MDMDVLFTNKIVKKNNPNKINSSKNHKMKTNIHSLLKFWNLTTINIRCKFHDSMNSIFHLKVNQLKRKINRQNSVIKIRQLESFVLRKIKDPMKHLKEWQVRNLTYIKTARLTHKIIQMWRVRSKNSYNEIKKTEKSKNKLKNKNYKFPKFKTDKIASLSCKNINKICWKDKQTSKEIKKGNFGTSNISTVLWMII